MGICCCLLDRQTKNCQPKLCRSNLGPFLLDHRSIVFEFHGRCVPRHRVV